MATLQEYGPHLKARIDPLITGVGPVEAAAGVSEALTRLSLACEPPDLVVSLGSAGSRGLDHAGLYQVASVSYRDMDASPFGFEKGCTPMLDEPAVIPMPHRIAGIPAASLSTGGNVISGPAYDHVSEDMVDMETYAVVRAVRRFGRDVIGLRGISDGRAAVSRYEDWTEYLHIVDEKLGLALDRLFEDILAGRIRPRG
jgi:adenosylhomocysteine nucleosidase